MVSVIINWLFGVFILVVFVVGGLLHVHQRVAFSRAGFTLSLFGQTALVVSLGHVVIGGKANTIQFPHISLIGFGIKLAIDCGAKHIAIPNPKVSVGTIYNLKFDIAGSQKIPPAHAGVGGRIGIIELVGNARIGKPFPNVWLSVLNVA